MVGWHHRLNGHECEQAPGVGDGQRSLGCCSPRGHKEADTAERLNNLGLGSLAAGGRQGRGDRRSKQEQHCQARGCVGRGAPGRNGRQTPNACPREMAGQWSLAWSRVTVQCPCTDVPVAEILTYQHLEPSGTLSPRPPTPGAGLT